MSETECSSPTPCKKPKLNEEDDFSKDVEDTQGTESEQKYHDFVTSDEVEKLKEFHVLDEVKSDDEESEGDDSDDEKSDGIADEDLDKMLDENLPEEMRTRKPKEKPYVTRQKIVLEEKGVNHFEVLPLDWLVVRHYSGMPVYMHRPTRVCTLARPYFIGKENTRRHQIPISAIPCLNYRRALEEEAKQEEIDRRIAEQIRTGSWKDQKPAEASEKPHDVTSTEDLPKEADEVSSTDNVEENGDKMDISNVNVEINDSKEIDDKTESNNINPAIEISTESNESDKTETNNIETSSKINDGVFKCPYPVARSESEEEQLERAKRKERAEQTEREIAELAKPLVLPGGLVMPPPRVERVEASWKTKLLTAEDVNDYCKALFKFKTVNIMHFKRWADRRKYAMARKSLQYPTLPLGTKLITIPAAKDGEGGGARRDWVMNMNGRSYLSVFHEYVRKALKQQPVYEFTQLENASSPYQATVYIGGMAYGVGRGSSKRLAKAAAARASIHVLIPDAARADQDANEDPDFSFFDYVSIEDPRIAELCAAACEPGPHAVLRTCLVRNTGATDKHIDTEIKKLEYQKVELTMRVGRHSATVVCKNKKTAKQRASQAILQALHPHIKSWGSLLRLYGSRSVKSCKEKKQEEQEITLLQDKAKHNEPNYAVLEKLKLEMRRLRERDEAVVPIGTFLVKDDLPEHSGSNLNNVEL